VLNAYEVACCPELFIASVRVGVRYQQFVAALHKVSSLSVREDIESVDPSSRFRTSVHVVRTSGACKGAMTPQIW
jgi:hypothetical protein